MVMDVDKMDGTASNGRSALGDTNGENNHIDPRDERDVVEALVRLRYWRATVSGLQCKAWSKPRPVPDGLFGCNCHSH